jgi:hypothetical protein
LGTKHFCNIKNGIGVNALVKKENIASKKAFQNAGYSLKGLENIKGHLSYRLIYKI